MPPTVKTPRLPSLHPARQWTLANGTRVVGIDVRQAPILSLELIWDGGRPFERKRLAADAANTLLLEGTKRRSAAEVEDLFESVGAVISTPEEMDTANLGLETLTRHAEKLLPVLAEIIAEPAYTEEEFERYLRRGRQQLRENLGDPDTLAYRLITEAIFGEAHPYGYNGQAEDYDALMLDDVRDHFERCLHPANCTLLLTGPLDDDLLNLVERTLGSVPRGGARCLPNEVIGLPPAARPPETIRVHRPRAQQTMIRRGRAGFGITHEDYPALVVLDTVLGGYYGSRLMRNIREEHGYTYGIDSDLDTYRFGGSFGISADVANENLGAVRREIGNEIRKLREIPVGKEELEMVRAYLLGSLVMDLDGPLSLSTRYRYATIKNYEPLAHLRRLEDTFRTVTAERLQEVAVEYLRPEMDHEVVVGGADELA